MSDTYVKVKTVRVDHIIVDHLDVKSSIQILHQLAQLRATNTVGAVDSQRALDLNAAHDLLERVCELLVVALLGGLTVLVLCSKGVLAADNVVELRGGHIFPVDELDLGSGQGGAQNAHEAGARGTSIAGKDDAGRVGHFDIDFLHELIVDIGDLIERGICQPGCILFPLGLNKMVSLARTSISLSQMGISYFEHLTLQ